MKTPTVPRGSDICECGEFRSQHRPKCSLCECVQFRFAHTATPEDLAIWEAYHDVERVADVVLNYRPKSKQPKPRKRKKAAKRA